MLPPSAAGAICGDGGHGGGVPQVVVVDDRTIGSMAQRRCHQPLFVLEVNVGGDVVAHVGVGNHIFTQGEEAEGCNEHTWK